MPHGLSVATRYTAPRLIGERLSLEVGAPNLYPYAHLRGRAVSGEGKADQQSEAQASRVQQSDQVAVVQHLRHLLRAHEGGEPRVHRVHRRGLQRQAPDRDPDRSRRHHRRAHLERGQAGLRSARRERHHADLGGPPRRPRHAEEGVRRRPLGQEPHHRAHLSGDAPGCRHQHLPRRYRRVHLRPDLAAEGAELSHRKFRVRHRGDGLPRARLHAQRARHEALHRSLDRLDPKFHLAAASRTATTWST